MGCRKLTYYPYTELNTVNTKKELTLKISSETLRSSYLFGFNGKEKDDELKGEGNSLDFGARIYDSRLGRWMSLDPLQAKYPELSPFNFVGNMPINAIDPDGKIIIFINGNHYGDGGCAKYWRQYETTGLDYTDYPIKSEVYAFDKEVMTLFNDYKAVYRDGALGGWAPFNNGFFGGKNQLSAEDRRIVGSVQGYSDAKPILDNLTAGETIKIVAHSMGAAYAKGYIEGLKQYMKENNITAKIEIEVDFSPFQPDNEANSAFGSRNPNEAEKGSVPTFQASHNDDSVAGNAKMKGSKQVDTSGDKKQGHSIFDYKNTVKKIGKLLQEVRSKK